MEPASTRPYHSPRRAAAALATRGAVLEAAEALFAERGYAGATLAGIADAAGVSLATVKLVAPTKARLLLAAFEARVRGDANEVASEFQNNWQSILAEASPEAIVRGWVALTAGAHERSATLFDAITEASGTDPELAEVDRRGSAGRRANYQAVIDRLAALGSLRPDLDVAAAVDIAWVINSPRTFGLFRKCGWSTDRWTAWITDALLRELLGS